MRIICLGFIVCGLTPSRDPSFTKRQPIPTPNSNSWATASTTTSSYQPYTGAPGMSNVSSLQMSLPVHGSKEIETTHNSDAKNTAEDSIYEPVLHVPQVSVGPLRVSQALQSLSPPPVRLGHSRTQSVQGNPPTKPRSKVPTERPKSAQAASCTRCLTPFSSTNPKYRCPNCQKFFDNKCSSKKITIGWVGLKPFRVDDECFAKLSGEKPLG